MSGERCLCGGGDVVIYSCSGAANVGQIANQAAVELTQEGVGTMNCAVGIGALVSGMIATGRGSRRIVAIDGCPLKCLKKVLEKVQLEPSDYILVTDLGIEKTIGSRSFTREQVVKVKDEVVKSIKLEAQRI
ncbi:putative zinc-binding protein [bacterium]|nr:putative zinc-binding protein [bacterium]